MFNKLVASGGRRNRSWSTRTVTISVALHLVLLAGAVYASVTAPTAAERRAEEEVTFVELTEQEPEAPKAEEAAPPPPPPEPEAPPETPPPPRGFQELVPPAEAPAVIPDVDATQAAVRAEDFSGIGQAGGAAQGVAGGTPTNVVPDSVPPVFTVEETGATVEIINMREVQNALVRNYPRQYADAGIAGQVQVKFMIDEGGRVPASSVTVISATNDAFGEAAVKAVQRFRFKPIKYRGGFVRVWATMPISFQPPR